MSKDNLLVISSLFLFFWIYLALINPLAANQNRLKCVLNIQNELKFMDSDYLPTYKTKFSDKAKYSIVMVRHGESEWNKEDKFCGWVDVDLSEKGYEDAEAAGKALKDAGYKFDVAHTSVLTRAQNTLCSILEEIDQKNLPVQATWCLNERHYGELTGMSKSDAVDKHGEKKVGDWRRKFNGLPPAMEPDHQYYNEIVNDPRYKDHGPSADEFPTRESLELTIKRIRPHWEGVIVPQIKQGARILIVAHGTSLRALVKILDNIPDEGMRKINLPNGIPFVYELDENLKPVVSMKFLADDETVKRAMDAVAAIGKDVKAGLMNGIKPETQNPENPDKIREPETNSKPEPEKLEPETQTLYLEQIGSVNQPRVKVK